MNSALIFISLLTLLLLPSPSLQKKKHPPVDLLLGEYELAAPPHEPDWGNFLTAFGFRKAQREALGRDKLKISILVEDNKSHFIKYFNDYASYGVNFFMGKKLNTLCPSRDPCEFLGEQTGSFLHTVWKDQKTGVVTTIEAIADEAGLNVTGTAGDAKALIFFDRKGAQPRGAPPPAEHAQGAPPPAEHAQGAPPPAEHAQGAPPPAEHAQGAPPPAEHGQGAPPPAEHDQGVAPPAEHGQGAPPPAEHDQGAPPPAGGEHGEGVPVPPPAEGVPDQAVPTPAPALAAQ